ncbi:MAG: transcription-repair coupling factor [Ignavibacteriae bacterium]|nr:transcription-repair coupling factor [Ignavibacteriota bacterium]MCB9214968.1 transcription-repair coupling factor [Ignavibacteria bacterium]
MRHILDTITRSAPLRELLEELRKGKNVAVTGLAGSLRSLVAAVLYQRTGEPLLILHEDREEIDSIYADLVALLGSDHILLFREEHHTGATTRETLDAEVISLTDVLKVLSDNPVRIILADLETLAERVPTSVDIGASVTEFRRGAALDFEKFARSLALGGFEKTDIVDTVGEFAVRGGIIDIFPIGSENPYRIEFFGDEIDSIREFDPASQRSVRDLDRVSIMSRVFHSENEELLTATLFDHLKPGTLALLDEPERLFGLLEERERTDLIGALEEMVHISHSTLFGSKDQPIDFGGRPQPTTSSSLRNLCAEVGRLLADNNEVWMLADGDEMRRRLADLIEGEIDRALEDGGSYAFNPGQIRYESEVLSEGFVFPTVNLAIFTEHQVFDRRRARVQGKRKKKFKGFTLRELKQLRSGDYVVHIDKGIGKFVGLDTIEVKGSRVEAVKLQYASGGTLYVNLNYINRLQKYSSKEGSEPKLSELGSKEWERRKARAKRRVKDIARELIKLYAKRKSEPGLAFPPDTTWQREMEASFMYEDTPDQATATYEVKRDMENGTPMDRLVCGDVGFGKTEVAVRAAFKAVQAGVQVAVLCPTTILAQQHYNTFRDRLSRYAVSIGLLSRFRSKAQQKETLAGLKQGSVDVLIGTHRMLSKDVKFKSLGLLIIDEEQRFGVSAKEKLRELRASVDTLTLTATPIPRTLNFSLLGARDLSVIETPPRNRLPIVTEVIRWDEEAIGEAIREEIKRGGQCFLVHWRIGDIEELAGKLREIVPEARVTAAHGQMTATEVESTMMKFIEREYDILVATKIIESGIDIPSVNTIIINRADKFGLAELYQLRGRVGRSGTQAYCYMVVPPGNTITRDAMKRIQAIRELSDLGSGLKLAMRDLEIRGAGNLLGGEQSGFIDDIGFETYQKIVDEAVGELKREEFSDLFSGSEGLKGELELPRNEEISIELPGDALIPREYIADDSERYDFYQRMYTAADRDEIATIFSEMRDRFGEIPEETVALQAALLLRLAAMPTGAISVRFDDDVMRLDLPPDTKMDYYDRWFQPIMQAVGTSRDVELETKGRALAILFKGVETFEDAERVLSRFVAKMVESLEESVVESREL